MFRRGVDGMCAGSGGWDERCIEGCGIILGGGWDEVLS